LRCAQRKQGQRFGQSTPILREQDIQAVPLDHPWQLPFESASFDLVSGPVNDAASLGLYHRWTALVFPTLHEGFGLPVVEAMATVTPVVTSTTTSMPEVAGQGNALLVDPREPDEIAEAMRRVAGDAALWSDLAQRGLARSRAFTWQQVCERARSALGLAG
jgi:glycosyltransferase involved in cell wall biosynthesis